MSSGPCKCSQILWLSRGGAVLGIGKLGVGQVDYYLSAVADGVEDYYMGEGEAPGEWMGRGAARLGLAGEVDAAAMRAVLDGVDPVSGERMAGRKGHDRVPGWDLTFSAPKSVSVLYGLGNEVVAGAVVEAHRAAVQQGLGWLEEHGTVSRRRVDGSIEEVRGEGLVVGAFRHRTSRAGDPQLHTHCLAANMTEHVDGGSGSLHSPRLYHQGRTAGFLYQAVLRGELTERLGVQWGPVHNGYAEIEGIGKGVLEQFSKRRAEIEAAMVERGEGSARAAQAAALETRAAKDYDVDATSLGERWRAEAAAVGFGSADIDAAVGASAGVQVTQAQLDDVAEEMTSARGLTALQASFDRRDVARAWCEALPAGVVVDRQAIEGLVNSTLGDARVVPVLDTGTQLADRQVSRASGGEAVTATVVQRRWSTTEMLGTEQRLIETAVSRAGCGAGRVEAGLVASHLEQRADLSEEQAAMVEALTTSGDGVQVVVGLAGAGKTYALEAAANLWREAGYRPMGVALAAKAAAGMEAASGIPSTTVAVALMDMDHFNQQYLTDRHVVVVDEAAMVDTRRLERLSAHAAEAGAKLVLVGDHGQLPSIEAGGALAGLVGRLGAVELRENRRQVEGWERDTLAALRSGSGAVEVIDAYENHGRLHLGATVADARSAMVTDWFRGVEEGGDAVMIALRRADVADLNARARALLVGAGRVESEGLTVVDTNPGGSGTRSRTFAVGDRVVCLQNDRQLEVHNSMFATVTAVDEEGTLSVVTGKDETRAIPADYVQDGNLEHAYAATIHKSQGETFDRLLFLGDDRLYRQAAYTAMSRGRDRNDFYLVVSDDQNLDSDQDPHGRVTDDEPLVRLARALARDGAKTLALDEASAAGATAPGDVPTVAPLAVLWAQRDALFDELAATVPADHSAAAEIVAARAAQAEAAAAVASLARAGAEEVADMRRGPRRRHEHAAAQRNLARLEARESDLVGEWRDLAGQVGELEAARGERAAWVDANKEQLEKLGALERGLHARTVAAARAAELQRPAVITSVIGDPPVSLVGREQWREAAGALESYRARWGPDAAFDPAGLVAGPQAAHALEVAARVEVVNEVAEVLLAGPEIGAFDLG